MTIRTKQRILLAKLESTYGSDASPNNAADAVKATEVTITPLESDEIEKIYLGQGTGTSLKKLIAKRVQLQFSIDLAAAGTAGKAPKYAHLLKAAGFKEVMDSQKKTATYAPDITAPESVTLAFNVDGNLHKMVGARGTAVFTLNAREVPTIQFTFTGLFVAPTATAKLANKQAFNEWVDGIAITKANTPTATIDSTKVEFENLSFDMGDTITYINRTNVENVVRRDRNASGSCTIAAVPIASKDLWAIMKNENLVAVHVVHGSGTGKVIDITAPQVQLTSPAYADSEGEQMQSFEMGLLPKNGSDEISLVYK